MAAARMKQSERNSSYFKWIARDGGGAGIP
jgi:hypothetical protein